MTSIDRTSRLGFCSLAALLLLLFAAGAALAHPPTQHDDTPATQNAEPAPNHREDVHESAAHEHAAGTDHPVPPVKTEEHDHAAHEVTWAETGFERFLAWLGAFHPAATNFPIALLIAAALAELMHLRGGREGYRSAARFCLWAGALTATATAVLGWLYAGFDLAGDDRLLAAHRWNGTVVGLLALAALWTGERHRRSAGSRATYHASLLLVALLAGLNGYLGGRMLYGADHYDWPEPAHEDGRAHADGDSHERGSH